MSSVSLSSLMIVTENIRSAPRREYVPGERMRKAVVVAEGSRKVPEGETAAASAVDRGCREDAEGEEEVAYEGYRRT